ncbi:MAG: hypothetical protein AB8H47_27665 [Bacteroidia bacterium]
MVLYLGIVGFLYQPTWEGDEKRFQFYAENLTQGYYAEAENPEFRNGPGYPLFLAPFIALGLPKLAAVFANIFLTLGGLMFFQAALKFFVSSRQAYYLTLFMGLYPVMLKELPNAVYEAYYFFLICGFLYFFLRANQKEKKHIKDFLLAGCFIGMLAMTRFVYGYSLFFSLPFLGIAAILFRKPNVRGWAMTVGVGILFCLPYLAYTYSLSGKLFYWGTNGGEVLYWMSAKQNDEFGDWQSRDEILYDEIPQISPIHKEFFQSLIGLNHIERDQALKKRAKENIKANPSHYLQNWTANVVRLFWGFPKSFRQQDLRPVAYIISNGLILVALILSLWIAWGVRKKIPPELFAIWFIFLLYLGLTSIVHAVPRYLVSVVPFWVLWIGYIKTSFTTFHISADD